MGISISRGEIEVAIAEFKKNLENCRIWKNMQMVGGNLINYFDLYSMPLRYGLFVGQGKDEFFFRPPFPWPMPRFYFSGIASARLSKSSSISRVSLICCSFSSISLL